MRRGMENCTILDKETLLSLILVCSIPALSKLDVDSLVIDSFSGLDNAFFGDEDTVEELTFVLGSDLADLGNLSARK